MRAGGAEDGAPAGRRPGGELMTESTPVVVVGTGAMGPGIAQAFALGGHRVALVGRSAAGLARAQAQLDRYWGVLAEADLATPDAVGAARARLRLTADREAACRAAAVVVEAIAEDLELKRALFRAIGAAAPPDALLASTTSALSATAIAAAVAGPERYVTMHFAQPAQLMRVVEVVPGVRTAPATVARARALLAGIGRRPVVCRDVPGFIWNRVQAAVLREAVALARDGVASVEEIEAVVKEGYAARLPAMGPFEHADLVGLDLIRAVMAGVWPHLDASASPDGGPIGALVARGELGIKSGRGFHDWTARDPAALRAARDAEIIRRLRLEQAAESPPDPT
jgi:3-hydroxybutyryl-CoA dehydrogenase